MGRPEKPTRRTLLKALPPAVLALAGCSGDEEGSSPTPTTTATPTDTPTPTETATKTAAGDGVATRLSTHAIPIETVDPTARLGDLTPLHSSLADATVIGLGEATHGTREFFRMKHRLLRYLVEEIGLRLFAWEANFAETMLIDDYVTGGDVDVETALDNVYFWTWDTAAVRSMLQWLRSFNEGREPSDEVRVYGIDAQYAAGPMRRIRSYLADVDPQYLEGIRDDLDTIVEQGLYTEEGQRKDDVAALADDVTASVGDRLESHREEYVAAASRRDWELAKRHVWTVERVLARLEAYFDEDDREEYYRIRDETMANNVTWVREFEDADRVAVWGHNDHVADRDMRQVGIPRLGRLLREEYGEDYYVVGFDFAQGRVRARDLDDREMTVFDIDAPPEETLSATLAAASDSLYALDFHDGVDEELGEELDAEYGIHTIGGAYNPDWQVQYRFPPVDLTAEFDALIFVPESTETTLLRERERTETPTATAE